MSAPFDDRPGDHTYAKPSERQPNHGLIDGARCEYQQTPHRSLAQHCPDFVIWLTQLVVDHAYAFDGEQKHIGEDHEYDGPQADEDHNEQQEVCEGELVHYRFWGRGMDDVLGVGEEAE